MIQIELTEALGVYSFILGALVAGIWLYTELSVKRPQRFLGKQFLWRCIYCNYTYLDESAERVSACPRCQSFNSVEDKPTRRERPQVAAAEGSPLDEKEPRRNTSKRKRPGQRRRGPRRRR